MDTRSTELVAALRNQIGTHGRHEGREFELIEVLEHEPAVVLRDCGERCSIQNDMHGEAHRMVHTTHTVPVLSEVSASLHPVLTDFFPEAIVNALNSLVQNNESNHAD